MPQRIEQTAIKGRQAVRYLACLRPLYSCAGRAEFLLKKLQCSSRCNFLHFVLDSPPRVPRRSGLLKEVQYSNGGKVQYAYHDYDWLTGVKYDGEASDRYTYKYDVSGDSSVERDGNLKPRSCPPDSVWSGESSYGHAAAQ